MRTNLNDPGANLWVLQFRSPIHTPLGRKTDILRNEPQNCVPNSATLKLLRPLAKLSTPLFSRTEVEAIEKRIILPYPNGRERFTLKRRIILVAVVSCAFPGSSHPKTTNQWTFVFFPHKLKNVTKYT
jgi:hypothetical protein